MPSLITLYMRWTSRWSIFLTGRNRQKDMVSQMELIRSVSAQSETIEKYIS